MTTARATYTGPAHQTIAGRTICGGTAATIPAGDAPPCAQCERSRLRNERIRGRAAA